MDPAFGLTIEGRSFFRGLPQEDFAADILKQRRYFFVNTVPERFSRFDS